MIPGAAGSVGAQGAQNNPVDLVDPGEVDPAALSSLVLSCPGVVAMHGGLAGEAASYLPGRRVTGVRVLADRVEVHVIARWPVPVSEIAEQVRTATSQAVGGRRVDVVIGDVELPATGAAP